MRITIDLKIFLFAIIFIITKQIEFYAILMAYAIIHELGHLLCGVFLRLKPETFSITPFGLQISFKPEISLYNSKVKNGTRICVKKMLLAFAGPLTNFIIVFILIILNNLGVIVDNIFLGETAIYANILIGVFNLIPIYPLDGGRILKGIISIFKGKKKAEQTINKISIIIGIIISALGIWILINNKNIAILFFLLYIWIIIIQENKKLKNKRLMYEILEKSIEKNSEK